MQKQLLTKQMLFEVRVVSVFNEVASLKLSCEYCEIFKDRFFLKTPQVAASEKFINFPGKHQ